MQAHISINMGSGFFWHPETKVSTRFGVNLSMKFVSVAFRVGSADELIRDPHVPCATSSPTHNDYIHFRTSLTRPLCSRGL